MSGASLITDQSVVDELGKDVIEQFGQSFVDCLYDLCSMAMKHYKLSVSCKPIEMDVGYSKRRRYISIHVCRVPITLASDGVVNSFEVRLVPHTLSVSPFVEVTMNVAPFELAVSALDKNCIDSVSALFNQLCYDMCHDIQQLDDKFYLHVFAGTAR